MSQLNSEKNFTFIHNTTESKYRLECSGTELSDASLEKLTVQKNFNFYQNLDFGKLIQKIASKKSFSLFPH